MKKFMISLAIASIAMVSYAQETVSEVVVPTLKNRVITNTFGSNWFLGVNGGVNLYNGVYMNGESVFDHVSPAVQVYAGKWHTPGFGWRVAYNGLNIKAYENVAKKAIMHFHFDAMFNLSNLICGYNEDRIWNVIPFVGAGYATRTQYGSSSFSNMTGSIAVNAGIMNTFSVSKHWAINFELGTTFFRNGFSGKAGSNGYDMMFTALAGVTYKFNKVGWDNAPDVDAIMALNTTALAELNTQLQAKEAENAGLKNQLAASKQNLVAAQETLKNCEGKVLPTAEQSVFFAFNSSKIASKKEIINLQAIANAVKDSDARISVEGYADSATGSENYNKDLSTARAKAVADKLIEMGVPQDKIVFDGMGGVAVEKPANLNRRAIVKIIE